MYVRSLASSPIWRRDLVLSEMKILYPIPPVSRKHASFGNPETIPFIYPIIFPSQTNCGVPHDKWL